MATNPSVDEAGSGSARSRAVLAVATGATIHAVAGHHDLNLLTAAALFIALPCAGAMITARYWGGFVGLAMVLAGWFAASLVGRSGAPDTYDIGPAVYFIFLPLELFAATLLYSVAAVFGVAISKVRASP